MIGLPGGGGRGGWYSRVKVKESIKGFSWVGNFPVWVGKFFYVP